MSGAGAGAGACGFGCAAAGCCESASCGLGGAGAADGAPAGREKGFRCSGVTTATASGLGRGLGNSAAGFVPPAALHREASVCAASRGLV